MVEIFPKLLVWAQALRQGNNLVYAPIFDSSNKLSLCMFLHALCILLHDFACLYALFFLHTFSKFLKLSQLLTVFLILFIIEHTFSYLLNFFNILLYYPSFWHTFSYFYNFLHIFSYFFSHWHKAFTLLLSWN